MNTKQIKKPETNKTAKFDDLPLRAGFVLPASLNPLVKISNRDTENNTLDLFNECEVHTLGNEEVIEIEINPIEWWEK